MDYIRTAYTTEMRLWAGSPDTVPVRWFRAPTLALVYTGESPFRSTVWRRDKPALYVPIKDTDLGETTQAPGPYDRGRNMPQYRGQSFCGRPGALAEGGVEGLDPPIVTNPDGTAPCCSIVNPASMAWLRPQSKGSV